MTKDMVCAEIGSVSWGTMRAEDLIPTFADELESLIAAQPNHAEWEEHARLVAEARAIEDFDSEEAVGIVEALFDVLEDFAPDGAYFGAHEGDGSDYGFWPVDPREDEEEEVGA